MIYTPSKHPKQAITVISIISVGGIFGGYLVSQYIMAIALIYWMQYTAVLSYLQFKHKSRHKRRNFTEYLLHPQVRFFVFEFLAFIGIGALLKYSTNHIGALSLTVWLLFSLNFYFYYKDFKKYG